MIDKQYENISVGTSIQLTYQKLDQTLEQIFKELIDNSTQSFFDNREELKNVGIDKCSITIDIRQDEIIIEDNAFGMNREQFGRALRLNAKPKQIKGSRNQFGMGLKYSAINLGDEYTIETSTLGSNQNYHATIKSEELALDIDQVLNTITHVSEDIHYTKITIRRLRKEIDSEILSDLIKKLGKIYRRNIHNNELEIIFLPNNIVYYDEPELETKEDGGEYLIDFSEVLELKNKTYNISGWVGILKTASTHEFGDAGFSLVKDDRIVIMNYKPRIIFGAANSFPYQRITGEITVDDFPDNFNKAGFDWDNGLEIAFLEILRKNEQIMDMVNISKKLRKKKPSYKPPVKEVERTNKQTNEDFSVLKNFTKTVVSKPLNEPVPVYMENLIEGITPVKFEFEGKDFTFYVIYQDTQEEWFDIKDFKNNNRYIISINNNFSLFENLNKNSNNIIQKIIMIIVTAELTSITSGQFNHSQMRNKINQIMGFLYGEK